MAARLALFLITRRNYLPKLTYLFNFFKCIGIEINSKFWKNMTLKRMCANFLSQNKQITTHYFRCNCCSSRKFAITLCSAIFKDAEFASSFRRPRWLPVRFAIPMDLAKVSEVISCELLIFHLTPP